MTGKESDQLGQRFKAITSDLKLYIEKRVELLLLNVGEQMSRFMAESLQKMTGILMLLSGVVFLLVALAIYLGDLLNNPSLGYLIVAAPLILMGFLFFYLKPKSLRENLQRHFESELVNALTAPGSHEENSLNLPTAAEEEKS